MAAEDTESLMNALKKFTFWGTQPVPTMEEKIEQTVNEPIEPEKPVSEIRKEPFDLPNGFEWNTLDIGDPDIMKELYILLNENYVEDEDNKFRFDYSTDYLRWCLKPPGWVKDWHIGVRVTKSKKLVGFISAIPAHVKVYAKVIKTVEINFLCVHKKLRAKRMTPVLIKEITRRVHLTGIFQAVYTSGTVIPKPIAICRYYHRPLNPKKLIEVEFSHLSERKTLQRAVKLYKLPEDQKLLGYRKMDGKDVKDVHKMLNDYLSKFDLSPVYSIEEIEHLFLPRADVVDSFVVEDPTTHEILGFSSFFSLSSTVIQHPKYKSIRAAYAYYNVGSGKVSLKELMQDTLVTAKNAGYDVFNALDLMDNKTFLGDLKFNIGNGKLHFYLFNWKCADLKAEKVGLVLQ